MLYLQSSAISTVKSQEIYDNDLVVVEHVAQLSLLKIEDLDEWWNDSPTDLSLVISICWHTCKNHSLKSSYEALCQFPTNGSLSGLWRRGCRANCNGLLTWSHSTAIRDFIRIHAKAFELLWLHRERHRHANSMQSMSSSGEGKYCLFNPASNGSHLSWFNFVFSICCLCHRVWEPFTKLSMCDQPYFENIWVLFNYYKANICYIA